ncbi:MAG: DUF58 domain-containing protein [Coriobacteriia bacterium]|nr:DUF58 domain-containing protein [Coriobacteriia bacterium]
MGAFFKTHASTILKVLITVALLGTAALPAVLDNTIIGYLPLLMVVAGILFSFAYLQILKRSVTFQETGTQGNCLRGEASSIGVKVTNGSFLLCPRIEVELFVSDLEGNVDAATFERISLLPKEERELMLAARFDHIGEYQVGLRSFTIFDLFGLFSSQMKTARPSVVSVAPRLADLSGLDVVHQSETDVLSMNRSVINDGFDYVGMREYVLGDTMKTIHWKASARFGDLMTRLYEKQVNPDICVVLDATSRWPHGEQMMCLYDAVIEGVLSMASYAVENGIESTVATADENGVPVEFLSRGSWGYEDLMRAVPKLRPSKENAGTAQLLHRMTMGMYSSSNIAVFSSNPTEQLLSEVISAHAAGKHVQFLMAHPADWERAEEEHVKRMLSRLSAARVPYYLYSTAQDLEEVRI